MNPRWKMLLWEQWRTAGMICLAFCGVSVLHGVVLHYNISTGQMAPQDAASQMKFLLLTYPLIAALLLTARQDGRAQISFNIEPRLLRLPMPVHRIFIVTVGARIVCITSLIFINYIIVLTLPRAVVTGQWAYVVFPLYIFLVGQATAWSYKRAPIVTDGLFLLVILAFFAYRFAYGATEDHWTLLAQSVAHPVLLIAVPPLSIALTAYGIYLERRDEYFGPPDSSELLKRINHSFSLSVDKVRTPTEAQLWYENRRIGRLMPMITAVMTVTILLGMVSASDASLLREGYGQYVPLFVLPLAAMISGIRGSTMRSRYALLRPMSDGSLAAIQLLAQLRALFFSAAIAGIFSFLLFMAGTEQKQLFLHFREQGLVDYFDVFINLLRPFVISVLISWILLNPLGIVELALIFSGSRLWLVSALSASQVGTSSFRGIADPYIVAYSMIGIVVSFAVLTPMLLRARGKISSVFLIRQLCAGVLIASFIWCGSEQAKGTTGILAAIACGAIVILPISFATMAVSRRRHNAAK